MKIVIVLLALTYVAYGRHARREIREDLPFFPVESLNTEFRNFQLEGCSDEVVQCMKNIHEKARVCVDKFKENSKMNSCRSREDIKQGHKNFQEASFKWHKSLESCLAGNECEDCPPLVQNDAPEDEEELYLRKKRMIAGDSDDSSESSEDSELEKLKKSVMKCWKGVEKAKNECKKKAIRCEPFAQCFGEGPTPSDQRLARWHTAIKSQRQATSILAKDNVMFMTDCMANTAPVRNGRNALIADPEGVVIDDDEY